LEVLRHSQHSIWHPELPSWVPNWRLPQRCIVFATDAVRRRWQAHARFSNDLSELTVAGMKVDVVRGTQLEGQLFPGLEKSYTKRDNSKKFQVMPNSICHWTMQKDQLQELFIPAISRWSLKDIRLSNGGSTLLNLFLKMLSIKRNPDIFDSDWHNKTILPSSGGNLQHPEMIDFEDLQTYLEDLLVSRTVIQTDEFWGLAPDITEPGDFICLLSGCNAPVVLRPCGSGKFSFIGDAFLSSNKFGKDYVTVDDIFISEPQDMILI
jgi:hypothetical protein